MGRDGGRRREYEPDDAPANNKARRRRAAENGSAHSATQVLEDAPSAFAFACPNCGAGDARPKSNGDWWIGSFKSTCPGGGECLRELAAAVGAPGGGALIADASTYLSALQVTARSSQRPDRLPAPDEVEVWVRELARDHRAQKWLRRERGLLPKQVQLHRLGFASSGAPGPYAGFAAFTLPVYDGGRLVNLRKRFWPHLPVDTRGKAVKMVGLRGRESQLYPDVPKSRSVLLVAGEFDALVARCHGLPALTSTTGASLPEHLRGAFAGRRVAVVYDVGEERAASQTMKALRLTGASRAWATALPLPSHGDDITDWFVRDGRDADELLRIIREARA